jgi:hypothetical protein
MMTLDEVLESWIPYRLQALETLKFAWDWVGESDEPRSIEVLCDGKVKLRGNVAAVANPMIEVGIIHARALLEFLGLCVNRGRLSQVARRRADDIAVEHYSTPSHPLEMVTPTAATASYSGPPDLAENSLIAVFEFANKGLAHVTSGLQHGKYTEQHLEIACRGIPVLLHNHLYAKLGKSVPHPPSAPSKNAG